MMRSGLVQLGGSSDDFRPKGSLYVLPARELVTERSLAGAYTPDGVVARDTLRLVSEAAVDAGRVPTRRDSDSVVQICNEEAVWAGVIMPHYGHFLVESASRLWPLLPGGELEGLPVVFTTEAGRPFVSEWLSAFGLRTIELPEHGAVRFTRMFVPEPAWRFDAWIAPEIREIHLHARNGLDVKDASWGEVLWLSRSELGTHRAPHDERLLEWILDGHLTIIRPEQMTLADQVAAFEAASGVAGVIGSAFHTLLMTRRMPDCLYLCPPWDKWPFPAQHRVLPGSAHFMRALSSLIGNPKLRASTVRRTPRKTDYRILIPETLKALSEILHPTLLEDMRMAGFASPAERAGGHGCPADDLDEAVRAVLRAPLSLAARERLSASFEAEGLDHLATEQLAAAKALGSEETSPGRGRLRVIAGREGRSRAVRGDVELGGRYVALRPRSLTVSGPRDLIATHSSSVAFEEEGTAAPDTARSVDHEIIELHWKSGIPRHLECLRAEIARECGDAVVWGGDFAASNGHFLIHSASRLWPLLPGGELEGLPVVFTTEAERPFVSEWLSAFGLRTIELPEHGAVRFTRMFVPEPAWRFDAWIAPEIREIHLYARNGLDVKDASWGEVLWLSRSELGTHRAPHDERLLEWILDGHLTIIRPEQMTLADQVAAFEAASGVAGVIGSAFHTLLMTRRMPDCLYLCPPWDHGLYPAQHRFLDGDATFARALEAGAWTDHVRNSGIIFPGGYRILIPETLKALSEILHPTLLEDMRMAGFASPAERAGGHGCPADDLDEAVRAVLRAPLSLAARERLSASFKAEGLDHLATEQLAVVTELLDEGLAARGRKP